MYGAATERDLEQSWGREKICLRRSSGIQKIYTWGNKALPTWRGADRAPHYDFPVALAAITLAGRLIKARISATVTVHRLAHGGVACAGHVASFLKRA